MLRSSRRLEDGLEDGVRCATRKSAATVIDKMGSATLSIANAKATGISFGGSGGVSEEGSGDCVASVTVEFEIRRSPFAVSPKANGA